jgi:opacity protein-like surface antigen
MKSVIGTTSITLIAALSALSSPVVAQYIPLEQLPITPSTTEPDTTPQDSEQDVIVEPPKKPKGILLVAPTYIHEDISVPASDSRPELNFGANIYSLRSVYIFPNGILTGGSVSYGKPDNNKISDEFRYEANLGYGKRFDKFYPYIVGTFGLRSINEGPLSGNYTYYSILPGVVYDVTKKLYVDVSYRYRDTFTTQLNWRSNTVFAALGYRVTPTTSVQFTYGTVFQGDFGSNSYAFSVIKRF